MPRRESESLLQETCGQSNHRIPDRYERSPNRDPIGATPCREFGVPSYKKHAVRAITASLTGTSDFRIATRLGQHLVGNWSALLQETCGRSNPRIPDRYERFPNRDPIGAIPCREFGVPSYKKHAVRAITASLTGRSDLRIATRLGQHLVGNWSSLLPAMWGTNDLRIDQLSE